MTREAWERTITDSAGNVLTGVQVSVFQSDGSTVATIYGQQSGGAPIANPFNTGVQTSAKFYADPGRYVVRALKDGLTKEFTDVSIADKAIRDDLGTAAYLTATTSPTDATPGRALRVGDFGIGGLAGGPFVALPVAGGVQADRFRFTGASDGPFGLVTSASTFGTTVEGFGYGVSTNVGGGLDIMANQYLQPIRFYAGEPNVTPSERLRVDGDGRLKSIGGAAFVGSVSAGGLSAIIERGSNANGDFVKFADGTLHCKLEFNEVADLTTPEGAIYRCPSARFWDFPAAFIDSPAVSGQFPAAGAWLSSRLNSASQAYYYWQAALNFTVDGNAILFASGRWR